MRLLNVHSLELEEFFEDDTPQFAILSHTWGKEELSFADWETISYYYRNRAEENRTGRRDPNSYAQSMRGKAHSLQKKLGYRKIIGCCKEAKHYKLNFVWVDTCCIDKTSSAELTEAINSMYRWYQVAEICFACLPDVRSRQNLRAFEESRWFTRGWTLQELLAPKEPYFLDVEWNLLFERRQEELLIERITGISRDYLTHQESLSEATIAKRMSWAANRQTSRTEDMAYCLLGIFGVNMPMLYGEGKRAFARLQEEIMKQSTDQTILAWGYNMEPSADFERILARSPAYFANGGLLRRNGFEMSSRVDSSFQMTNKGLHTPLRLCQLEANPEILYAVLNCLGSLPWMFVAFPVISDRNDSHFTEDGDVLYKVPGGTPVDFDRLDGVERTVFLTKRRTKEWLGHRANITVKLVPHMLFPAQLGNTLVEVFYPSHWSQPTIEVGLIQ